MSGPIGPKGVPVTALLGILKGMFTGSCVGHAGETWTPPPTSAPPAVTPPAGPAPRPTQTTRPTAAPPASTPTPLATVTPAPPPPPSTPTPAPPPPSAHAEQASVHHSVPTFANYHNASGPGPAIPASTWVQVTCKVYDPTIVSASPDGYWYRIASSPWTGLYAVANTFMNGDPPSGPYTHNTDYAVPNC